MTTLTLKFWDFHIHICKSVTGLNSKRPNRVLRAENEITILGLLLKKKKNIQTHIIVGKDVHRPG